MKITGGQFRNRAIFLPKQNLVRPTSAKVREAIFSMIGQDLQSLSFLDAFGGSGIMAIEAYSRGARPVVVCEKNKVVQGYIVKNIAHLKADIFLKKQSAEEVIASKKWDIIFLDPPYKMDIAPFMKLAFSTAQQFIVAETEKNGLTLDAAADWDEWRVKIYGTSKITIFRRRSIY